MFDEDEDDFEDGEIEAMINKKIVPARGEFPSAKGKKPKSRPKILKMALGTVCVNRNAQDSADSANQNRKLVDVLNEIRRQKYAVQVAAIRACDDPEEKRALKAQLPLVNNATYNGARKQENIRSHAGFCVGDIDTKENPNADLEDVRKRAVSLPFTISVFSTPSGGLKILFRVSELLASDKKAFCKAAECFGSALGVRFDLTEAGYNRFFVSSDPDAYIHPFAHDLAKIPAMDENIKKAMHPATALALFGDALSRVFFCEPNDFYFRRDDGEYVRLLRRDVVANIVRLTGQHEGVAAQIIQTAMTLNRVKEVLKSRAWTPAGVYESLDAGRRTLVQESPELFEPKEGSFDNIKKMLRLVFADNPEMLLRFLCWLKHAWSVCKKCYLARGSARAKGFIPILALVGYAGAGKDLLIDTLIKPIFGGEYATMDSYYEEKEWLGAIVSKGLVIGNDFKHLDHKERQRLGSRMKQVANCDFRAESKGKDQRSSNTQHVQVLAANIDEGGSYADVLPEINSDIEDKILVLALRNPEAVKEAYPAALIDENSTAIEKEIPALLMWLESRLTIPSEISDARYGVRGWIAPDAQRAIFDASSREKFFDGILCDLVRRTLLVPEEKEYTADEVDTIISNAQREEIIDKHFEHKTNGVAKLLTKLCKIYPSRYEMRLKAIRNMNAYRFKTEAGAAGATGTKPQFGSLSDYGDPFGDEPQQLTLKQHDTAPAQQKPAAPQQHVQAQAGFISSAEIPSKWNFNGKPMSEGEELPEDERPF